MLRKGRGKVHSYKAFISTKNSKGEPQADGKLVFVTQEGTFTHYKPTIYGAGGQDVENKYLAHTKKFADETYGTTLNSGLIEKKDDKFVGRTSWGVGKGSTMDAKFMSSFFVNASGNQIYDIFDYGTLTNSNA